MNIPSPAAQSPPVRPLGSHGCLLVAIDATLPNLQVLLDGLQPGHIPLLIQPQHDPLQQILLGLASPAAAPAPYSGLAIVAHASSEGIHFGARHLLTAADFRAAAATLRPLQLTSIDLWCCSLGRNPALLDAIATSSGALVSASTTAIGHTSLGGTWTLDCAVTAGASAAPAPDFAAANRIAPFSRSAREQWLAVLEDFNIDSNNSGGTVTAP